MQRLYQNAIFKIILVILFIVAAITLVFSACGLYLVSDEWYYQQYYDDPYLSDGSTLDEGIEGMDPQQIEDLDGTVVVYDSFQPYIYQWSLDFEAALLPALIIAIIILLAALIMLICAAGHRKGEQQITANHLDRVPLDLFLAIAGLLSFGLLLFAVDYLSYLRGDIACALMIMGIVLFSAIFLTTVISCATRFKLGGWWKNTLIFMWILHPLAKLLSWLWRKIALIFGNISLLWKGIILFIVFGLFALIFVMRIANGYGGAIIMLFLLALIVLVLMCLALIQMSTLKIGARRMAEGNLNYHIDTRNMFKDLRDHGNNLNRISDGMAAAVEERMKSEHFKTELITNVSHDLKTPLTSIINYVDLLEKEHIDNAKVDEYVEVLSRQTARLKKMTEDLVEASKASTGNIKMELTNTDMNELVRQLVGEYGERLEQVGLQSVVNIPEERLIVLADGRYLWRVFDNLLNNICKYSQPNTRVFVDLAASREVVWVALKNTSRDLLNTPADDLMERFVRGDSSRNSEGSGLGLSIARSLTELMDSSLHLEVDGDLFKVKISFKRVYD